MILQSIVAVAAGWIAAEKLGPRIRMWARRKDPERAKLAATGACCSACAAGSTPATSGLALTAQGMANATANNAGQGFGNAAAGDVTAGGF